MTITITIDAPNAAAAKNEMNSLLSGDWANPRLSDGRPAMLVAAETVRGHTAEEDAAPVDLEASINEPAEAKPTRQRGQPSPGKARRTKAEIAEDDAYEATQTRAIPPEQANISSAPEDRQDPENPDPVDDEETAEADAADEAAETASTKSGDALTHDDIRGILGKYRDVYGMDAAMEDGPVVMQEVCGEGVVKISDVPDDKIAAVLDAIKKAGNENRFDRKQVAA